MLVQRLSATDAMDRNTERTNERPRVHGAHSVRVSSRSPTQSADDAIRRQQLSKSFSSSSGIAHQLQADEPKNQQTTSPGRMAQERCFERKHQPDVMKDQNTTKGDVITITVECFDTKQKKQTFTVSRSCTIEEYMKWRFILSSQANLDQFNVNIEKTLGISGAITLDSKMYLQQVVNNSEDLKEMCDRLVGYAIGYLGQGLCVTEIDVRADRLHFCVKEIEQRELNIYAEILGDRLYVVSGNRDKKQITEYLKELVKGGGKQRDTSKRIAARPIWSKMAKLMQLDDVLKRHCKSTELEVTLETHPEKVFINLTGPETAVNMAEEEIKRMKEQMLREKCNINVTSKFALTELQVESFLDEHLSKQGIRCVTRQKKDGIYVYGFNSECLCKANREIQTVIIEKLCIVKGHLKHRKYMLVSYLRSRWPGNVVIHIEDSGLLHIVGVKKCVEDTHQIVSDLDEGKTKLEDLQSKQTNEIVKTKTVEAASEIQTGEDGSEVGSETKQDADQKHNLGTREKPNSSMKLGNDTILDKARENIAKSRTGNFSDESKTEVDLRGKQIPNKENGTKMWISEGNMPTIEDKEDKEAVKHIDENACSKEEVENIRREKQKETKVPKIEEQKNISQNTEESNDSCLKYFDVNTGANADSRGKKKEEQKEPKIGEHKNMSLTKESETVSITECMVFSDKKVWEFMMKHDARIFLNECANENNVSIHQQINRGGCLGGVEVTEEVLIFPNEGAERTVLWQTADKKQMMLTMKRQIKDTVDPGSRFVLVSFEEQRRNKESISIQTKRENGVTVALRVPSWKGGKENEKEQFMDVLADFISQTEETKIDHVLIHVEAVYNWPEKSFIPCVISEAVDGILFGSASETPNMVTLFLRDENKFDKALPFTENCIRKCSQAERTKQNKLQVIVMSGELDKTKADVIVNTTSRDLELSNGKVSATLLKTAGSGIQTECRKKYPKGISRKEVAVTGGYKLKCENVFHIALDRYIAQQEMNSIESIRSFMITCLKIASDMEHKTIAFPAIGTGVLKYPIDLVAAAMFESVERFKSMHTDTSLITVFFVIYPSDVKVMEIFKRNEETLEKPPEDRSHEGYCKKVQLKISGQRENIASAKSCVSERIEDELDDPSKRNEICFHGVTQHVYLALWYLFEENMKTMCADGVEVKHQDYTLFLSGKRKVLRRASEKMNEFLEEISKYHFSSLSVQGCNTQTVDGEVQLANRNNDVLCIFDKYRYIVHLCAHSSRKLSSVMNLLKEKLHQTQYLKSSVEKKASSSCISPQSVYGEKRRTDSLPRGSNVFPSSGEKHASAPESSFRGKANEETKENLNKHGKSNEDNDLRATKQHISTQVSLTQNTKNCKTFQMDKILVRVYEADILDVPVECIVNPANKNLDHHGGLAFLIAKAAGDTLERESTDIVMSKGGSLPVTSVVSTTAGKLNYKCILHAVGPCWYDYCPVTEAGIMDCLNHLRMTVINCFKHAEKRHIETIALPTISSGQFGVPKKLCAIQYATAIQEFSATGRFLKEIHIVDISHDMIAIVQSICDSVIMHGKAVNIDMKRYIQGVDTPNKGTMNDKTSFKNTGRDKLETFKSDEETAKFVKNRDRNQETYREDGTKLICTFSSNYVVQIYEGNILTLQGIEALICSDNRKGEAKGEVSKQLLQTNGKEYETEKSVHFKEKQNYGDVITTSGGKSNFEHILHAITPKKDIKALHMMYINLFEEIVKKNVSCIALPLLGTGTGKFGPDEGTQVLLKEWATFCSERKGHPLTIHLVLCEKTTSDLVKDTFRKYIDGTKRFIATSKQLGEEFKHELEYSEERETNTNNVTDSRDTEEDCVICMDKVNIPKKLKCGHTFCTECIEGYFRVKTACPTCGQVCGVITGDQPDGRMEIVKIKPSCVGYEGHRTLAVSYYFYDGTQGEQHPRPGSYYKSISRTGYLPDTKEGREVCAMLKVAFERRLVFTIGTSRTTGQEGVITWNDIHHKTDMRPNTQFGYPDKTYLQRVREELAVKGVTEKDVEENFVKELKADTFRHTVSTDTTL